MATDVDVQYFSHLNGLVLGNNWGDMIRLLDTCLVNGLPLTSITSASIDTQGDITLNLYAAHNCMLFQIIELTGFAPSELNGKYRIKGIPTATQLILKATHAGKTITTVGTAKLASLGYDIIFRDTNDVKRVYRAKNPTAQHPFIRVDESLASDTGLYASTYAKYAMVGLIEDMTHIDDYENTSKLQLPLDTADFKKNWKITSAGTSVVRGWSKWYWRRNAGPYANGVDTGAPSTGNSKFSLVGDKNAFYLNNTFTASDDDKILKGCGIIDSALPADTIPPWFLMTFLSTSVADTYINFANVDGSTPMVISDTYGYFLTPKYDIVSRLTQHTLAYGIMPDYFSGYSGLYSTNNIAALEIPLNDAQKYLRGTLKHLHYCGKTNPTISNAAPILADSSMYILDTGVIRQNSGGANTAFYYYLGEL